MRTDHTVANYIQAQLTWLLMKEYAKRGCANKAAMMAARYVMLNNQLGL